MHGATVMKRTSYFSRVGVRTSKSQLDAVFSAEMLDMASLRALARCAEDIPKTLRARVWTHLLFGWRSTAATAGIPTESARVGTKLNHSIRAPFLTQQLQSKFGDLRRAAIVLNEEALEKRRKTQRKPAELMAMFQLLCRVNGQAVESTADELDSVLQIVLSVFPEDGTALAFFSFHRMVSTLNRAEVNAMCSRTKDLLSRGQQEKTDFVDDKLLRSWFCTLFVSAFAGQVVYVWDILFSFEPPEREGYLCAVACAIVKLNVRPEAVSEVVKITTPVQQVMKLALQIQDNKRPS